MSDDTDRYGLTDFVYGHGDIDSLPSQQTEACGGTVECRACGKFHGWCDELTKNKENITMLPQAEGSTSNRASRGDNNKSNRLRVEDLSTTPREGKIVAVRADLQGKYGAQVIVKLAVGGETKFWYLDIKKNPNYKLLTAKFGHDENEWVGQKILLGTEKDDFTDNYFVRVSFPISKK